MDLQTRKRNYFSSNKNNQKKRKQFTLEPGMTGFLCTCNFRERDCVRDAYKLLNEFADEIYGFDSTKESDTLKTKVLKTDEEIEKGEPNSESEHEDEDDISTALNKEINELKAEYTKPVAARRFQVVDTGVKNLIFIRSTLNNPLELVSKIVTELDKTKQQRTRFLLRLLPIEVVCKAYMHDIKLKAEILFEKYFAQEPKTFSILFNRHSNNNIQRHEIIEDLAEIIIKKNPGNKADLSNPELAVVVDVIRGMCLMSIAPNYYRLKKYNLLEICNIKQGKTDTKKTDNEKSNDLEPETAIKKEKDLEPEAAIKEDTDLELKTAIKKENDIQPESAIKKESDVEPETAIKKEEVPTEDSDLSEEISDKERKTNDQNENTV